jgi:hypothetical protein
MPQLGAEFALTATNGAVWLSIGLGLALGAACLAFGVAVARLVGLLDAGAPVAETLGVGLASGLIVLASWWAAVWSTGRSAFTPVAVGFAVALGFAIAARVRRRTARPGSGAAPRRRTTGGSGDSRVSSARAGTAAGLFIVAIALLYGSTMAPSPRDGLQPVEFNDEAFYAVLSRDLADTGIETNLSASGFSEFPGQPAQTWYHWGELWLTSAVIAVFGLPPLPARFLVVLPILLLAAAALTGTLVRRATRSASRLAFLFGVAAYLFLAPVTLIQGPFFSTWAVGQIFGITLYGLAAVSVLLALYAYLTIGRRPPSWALATFVGSVAGSVLPGHIAVAVLDLVGIATDWLARNALSLWRTRRLPQPAAIWRRTWLAAGLLLIGSVAFGQLTGHGLGSGSPPIVTPFNDNWQASLLSTVAEFGILFSIAAAWFPTRRRFPAEAGLYLGTGAALAFGAIAWGARYGDFTSFYLFFGGVAVIATPVAAIAVRRLWLWLRANRRRTLAAGLVALTAIQLEFGAVSSVLRLRDFGPHAWPSTPVAILDAIRKLPADAKLAYRCGPFDESSFAVPHLVSIDAHTARRMVPMCFEAEVLSTLIGAPPAERIENLFFRAAPQRALYPDADARPTSAMVAAFLADHGIRYIYADARHPNTLVDGAARIASAGDAELLMIP